MDFDKLILRVKSILTSPKTEWPLIAQEPATLKSLFTGYIMILAGVSTVVGFLASTVFNHNLALFGIKRLSVAEGLLEAAIGYVLSLVVIYVLARVIDALAPSFGGERNRVQALKTAAYTYTASWVASVGLLIPVIGLPLLLVGEIFSIYLLYLGLPHTMKAGEGKTGGYTAVVIIISILLSWVIGLTVAATTQDLTPKPDAVATGQTPAEAKTGNASVQPNATNDVAGKAPSEVLEPERLKAFAPEYLDGLPRENVSAQRSSAMGLQIATAKAVYRNDKGRNLRLEIIDSGASRAVLSMMGWAGADKEVETSTSYERSFQEDGRRVREKWDHAHNSGEFSMLVGERFLIRVEGRASGIGALREAAREVDFAGLETLSAQGAAGR